MNATPTAASRAAPSRGLLAVLVISLCLNFLFVGAAGALALRWRLHPEQQALRMLTHRFTRRLDRADAHLMRATLLDHREQILGAWRAYRQSLKPLGEALLETPRSEEHLHAAEQQTREKRIALGDAVTDAFMAGAEKLSPSGRAALVRDRAAD